MIENIVHNINQIFDGEYGDDLHAGKIFLLKYSCLYHIYDFNVKVDIDTIFDFFKTEFKVDKLNILHNKENGKKSKSKNVKQVSSSYIVEIKDKLIVELSEYSLKFFFGSLSQKNEIKEVLKNLMPKPKKKKEHRKKFYMLSPSKYEDTGLTLQKFNAKKIDINIKQSYNDNFEPINDSIQKFLIDKSQNGIIMLHGKYGTGKSTYIRHLMHNINTRFIYIPLNVMYGISSPNLLSFFSNYKDSILILEDCEELIKPRTSSSSGGDALVNLLNLADGLLSDALSLKLICTFNANLKHIDPAILRKGRLAVRYEFEPLETEKAKLLAKANNIDIEINKPTTIADIFNNKQVIGDIVEGKNVGF